VLDPPSPRILRKRWNLQIGKGRSIAQWCRVVIAIKQPVDGMVEIPIKDMLKTCNRIALALALLLFRMLKCTYTFWTLDFGLW
jgi:hypothetical protein